MKNHTHSASFLQSSCFWSPLRPISRLMKLLTRQKELNPLNPGAILIRRLRQSPAI